MLRNIFQIAICHGRLASSDQTAELAAKNNHVTAKKTYFNSSDSSDSDVEVTTKKNKSPEPVVTRPTENEMLQAFKEQLGSLSTITFTLLSRIEQRLCEKFKVSRFDELEYGSFMNYIEQNEKLLFPVNTTFNFSSFESNENHSTVLISLEDLKQFISQALDKSIDQQYTEQLICYHFHIESFEQLGHGSFRSIINSINQKPKHTCIHYECFMFDEIPLLKQVSNKTSRSYLEGITILVLINVRGGPFFLILLN
jgi:hypothetical protein